MRNALSLSIALPTYFHIFPPDLSHEWISKELPGTSTHLDTPHPCPCDPGRTWQERKRLVVCSCLFRSLTIPSCSCLFQVVSKKSKKHTRDLTNHTTNQHNLATVDIELDALRWYSKEMSCRGTQAIQQQLKPQYIQRNHQEWRLL